MCDFDIWLHECTNVDSFVKTVTFRFFSLCTNMNWTHTLCHNIVLNRCRARKKAIVSDFSGKRLFPLPIFPHPSLRCRHSHFPIWWTIKRLLQAAILFVKTSLSSLSVLSFFFFWKFTQRKKGENWKKKFERKWKWPFSKNLFNFCSLSS